ncbi:MAG: hypothetical protein WCC90_02810 [Methylocella sp.]
MKKLALATTLWVTAALPAIADDLQSSREAVSQLLKKDGGGGLVAQKSKCPKEIENSWEFVNSIQVVPIDASSSSAVLIDSSMCGGGETKLVNTSSLCGTERVRLSRTRVLAT